MCATPLRDAPEHSHPFGVSRCVPEAAHQPPVSTSTHSRWWILPSAPTHTTLDSIFRRSMRWDVAPRCVLKVTAHMQTEGEKGEKVCQFVHNACASTVIASPLPGSDESPSRSSVSALECELTKRWVILHHAACGLIVRP